MAVMRLGGVVGMVVALIGCGGGAAPPGDGGAAGYGGGGGGGGTGTGGSNTGGLSGSGGGNSGGTAGTGATVGTGGLAGTGATVGAGGLEGTGATVGSGGAAGTSGSAGHATGGSGGTTCKPDVLLVQDRSGSMTNDLNDASCNGGCAAGSKWTAVTTGVTNVVQATQGSVNWGMKYFSDNNACSASMAPAVAIGR